MICTCIYTYDIYNAYMWIYTYIYMYISDIYMYTYVYVYGYIYIYIYIDIGVIPLTRFDPILFPFPCRCVATVCIRVRAKENLGKG